MRKLGGDNHVETIIIERTEGPGRNLPPAPLSPGVEVTRNYLPYYLTDATSTVKIGWFAAMTAG